MGPSSAEDVDLINCLHLFIKGALFIHKPCWRHMTCTALALCSPEMLPAKALGLWALASLEEMLVIDTSCSKINNGAILDSGLSSGSLCHCSSQLQNCWLFFRHWATWQSKYVCGLRTWINVFVCAHTQGHITTERWTCIQIGTEGLLSHMP